MTGRILRLSLAGIDEHSVQPDGRICATIWVELHTGELVVIPAVLERASDGALQISGATPWLQTEEDPHGACLVRLGTDPVELARAVDAQRWGTFPRGKN